nr:tail fiber protein [Achromobacter phage vB_Ade_ART]
MPLISLVKRLVKGSGLTNVEGDQNSTKIEQYMNSITLPVIAHDLDTYDTPGRFHQAYNAGAVAGSNYPVPLAGMLYVDSGQDSDGVTPVNIYQRYTPGTVDNHVTYVRVKVGSSWGGWFSAGSQRPVGTPDYWPLRASIPAGQIPQDGQTVSRAMYPDLTAMVVNGLLPVVAEATWQSDATQRGKYTLGDGSTTIRIPDLNGKSAGSLGAVVWRGDGLLSAETNGLIQRDALQNITATINSRSGPIVGGSGAVQVTAGGGAAGVTPIPATGTPQNADITTFDASRVARTATETRALNVTGVWTVHAFGAVVNPGSADAAQLASDYAVLNAAVQTIQGQISKAFGVGQQWYTYTVAERGGSNTYVNSTPQPILVKYTGTSTAAGNLAMVLDGENYLRIFWDGSSTGAGIGATMLVPPGGSYSVGGASFNRGTWKEYRGYR